jgi:hypothetical protein
MAEQPAPKGEVLVDFFPQMFSSRSEMNITAACEAADPGLIPGETTIRAQDVSGSIPGSYPGCEGSSPSGRTNFAGLAHW